MIAGRFNLPLRMGLLGILLLAGCGRADRDLLPVQGRATVNGIPLAAGYVSFRPDSSRGNGTQHHPTGTFTTDGNYELRTGEDLGAPLGWYKVLVFADENTAEGVVHPVMPKWATAEKYTREDTTDLRIEVVPAPAAGAYDLSLTK